MKFRIEYFDEIEATDREQAKEFLLKHLSRVLHGLINIEHKDASCFEINEIEEDWYGNRDKRNTDRKHIYY